FPLRVTSVAFCNRQPRLDFRYTPLATKLARHRICRDRPEADASAFSRLGVKSIISTGTGLDNAEEARWIDCELVEAAFVKQAAVLRFRSLKATRAAEHIQVAHRLFPMLVAEGWEFRHVSFDQ